MCRPLVRPLLAIWLLLIGTATAWAAVFDHAIGDAAGRSLRLSVPDGGAPVRGLIIYGNGAGGDSRGMATDAELNALAESIGFGVLATAYWGNFSDSGPAAELTVFETGLQRLAERSGRPELTTVPWLPIGHSNGGQMSYGLNALRPERTIATVVSKGGYYNQARPAAAARQTPGLLIAGEVDLDYRVDAISDLFFGNRPAGALWAWVEDQGVDHALGASNDLTLPFVEAVVRARSPVVAAPSSGAAALRDLAEAEGWLTDPNSYPAGLALIAPQAAYAGDRTVAGWLPNRRIAYVFRAFASYDKATRSATLSSGAGPVARGTTVTYTIGPPTAAWTAIEFFEGDGLLKRITPVDAGPLAVSAELQSTGYAVFHALVTLADGSRRTTPPRRVFVRASAPPSPAPVVTVVQAVPAGTVKAGADVTLAVRAEGTGLTYRWRREDEEVRGAAMDTVSWIAGAGDAGEYSVLVSDAAGNATKVSLGTLAIATDARLANLSARARVEGGDGVLIAGFVTTGANAGARKQILLRGVGPELGRTYGVNGALAGAGLRLFDTAGRSFAAATAWEAALAATFERVGAFALPAGSRDAALLVSVAPGGFTAHVSPENSANGVGLAEVYDADETAVGRLVNLSARAQVRTGDDILIGGFVVTGTTAATVLVRGAGLALRRPPFDLSGTLGDPVLTVHDRLGRVMGSNRGWTKEFERGESPVRAGLAPATGRMMAGVGAFPLAAAEADSALVLTLPAGTYSAHVSSASGATGIALVEIYEVR